MWMMEEEITNFERTSTLIHSCYDGIKQILHSSPCIAGAIR